MWQHWVPIHPSKNEKKIIIVICLGNCLQASNGHLTLTSCAGFSSGCPETHFITSDFYKCKKWKSFAKSRFYIWEEINNYCTCIHFLLLLDPACQELNLDHHCYKFDPNCPPNNSIKTSKNSASIGVLVVYIGLAMTIAASYLLFLYYRQKQQRKQKNGMLNYTSIKEGSHKCSAVTCPLKYWCATTCESVHWNMTVLWKLGRCFPVDSYFVCLFGVFRRTREFFFCLETSPLPVKGPNFDVYSTLTTYGGTDHPLIMVIPEDLWHSHLVLSVWQWSCHYLF